MKIYDPMLDYRAGVAHAGGGAYEVDPLDFNLAYTDAILIHEVTFILSDPTENYVLGLVARPDFNWAAIDDLLQCDDAIAVGLFFSIVTTSGVERYVSPPDLVVKMPVGGVLVACNPTFAQYKAGAGAVALYIHLKYQRVSLSDGEIVSLVARRRG